MASRHPSTITDHAPLTENMGRFSLGQDQETETLKRKSLFNIPAFITTVLLWQDQRDVLQTADNDFETLVFLLRGEIFEVFEDRMKVGTGEASFVSEKGEVIDVGFFLAIFSRALISVGERVDVHKIMASANGQSVGENALAKMDEVAINISEKSLKIDIEHMWILWISYAIHMERPVDPNKELAEYTIPKNNGNYVAELLNGNVLFENSFKRQMNEEEKVLYFNHYRRATRIIRNFMKEYVDPNIKHTGLEMEHCRPYEMFIYNFMYFRGIDITPTQALSMLKEQLYIDYANEVAATGGRKEKILIAGRDAAVRQ